jgi:4-amino-4-deoxy-L-arabinose transferase-like glycosyltransferase
MIKKNRSIYIALGLVFFAALAGRALVADLAAPAYGDEPHYSELAVELLQTGNFALNGQPTAWRTPGFPIFLAAIYRVAGENLLAARCVQLLISAISIVILFGLVNELLNDQRAALLSAVLWAGLIDGNALSAHVLPEYLSASLVMLALWTALFATRRYNFGYFLPLLLAAGLLVGFAILTRGYLVFTIVLVPLICLARRIPRKVAAAAFLAALALPLAWTIRNKAELGVATLSTETWQVVWHGNNRWSRGTWNGEWWGPASEQVAYLEAKHPGVLSSGTEVEQAMMFRAEAVNDLRTEPLRLLRLLPRKAAIFMSPVSYLGIDWVYVGVLLLSLFGLSRLAKMPDRVVSLIVLVFPLASVGVVCLITFGDPRFRFPVVFGWVAAAGYGLATIVFPVRAGNCEGPT